MKSNNEVLSIINYIEDRNGRINYDWFYHGTNYNIQVIKDILVNGIKCQKDLQIDARGSNGKYYISVLFEYDDPVNTYVADMTNAIGLDYVSDGLYQRIMGI